LKPFFFSFKNRTGSRILLFTSPALLQIYSCVTATAKLSPNCAKEI